MMITALYVVLQKLLVPFGAELILGRWLKNRLLLAIIGEPTIEAVVRSSFNPSLSNLSTPLPKPNQYFTPGTVSDTFGRPVSYLVNLSAPLRCDSARAEVSTKWQAMVGIPQMPQVRPRNLMVGQSCGNSWL